MISMLPLSKIDCEFDTLNPSRVKSLGNIILIPNQPVFTLSPQCCVLSGEAPNTNFMVCLTRSRLKPTIYPTQDDYPITPPM